MKKLKVPEAVKLRFRPGQLVQWFDKGWRAGHVVEIHRAYVKVRTIPRYKAPPGRARRIPITDIVPINS
jgi:hypothetical protein